MSDKYVKLVDCKGRPQGLSKVYCPKISECNPTLSNKAQFLEAAVGGQEVSHTNSINVSDPITYFSVMAPSGDDLVSVDYVYLQIGYECDCKSPAPDTAPANPPAGPVGDQIDVSSMTILKTDETLESRGYVHLFVPFGDLKIISKSIKRGGGFTPIRDPNLPPDPNPPQEFFYNGDINFKMKVIGFKVTRYV